MMDFESRIESLERQIVIVKTQLDMLREQYEEKRLIWSKVVNFLINVGLLALGILLMVTYLSFTKH